MTLLFAETTYRLFGRPVAPATAMFWLVAGLALWGVIRVISGRWDRRRITEYVTSHGGSTLKIEWHPLGGFGQRGVRTYRVTYRTSSGKTLQRTCKTSLFSGVFWTGGLESEDKTDEPLECPVCHSTIPPQSETCAKCGWTYRAQE